MTVYNLLDGIFPFSLFLLQGLKPGGQVVEVDVLFTPATARGRVLSGRDVVRDLGEFGNASRSGSCRQKKNALNGTQEQNKKSKGC